MHTDPPAQAHAQRALTDPPPAPTPRSAALGRGAAELLGFRVEVHPERHTVRVAPVGELDLATVPELRDRLTELGDAGSGSVVLDLRGVTFMDSSGLHLILAWAVHCERRTIAFELIPGPPAVQRVFEFAGTRDRLAFRARQRASPSPVPPRAGAAEGITT